MPHTAILIQHHIPQGVDFLDGEPVPLPHLLQMRELLGHQRVRILIRPEVRLPPHVMLQAAIPGLEPFGLGAPPQGNLVQDGWDEVWVFGLRGLLVDGVVGKGDVEAVALGGDHEIGRRGGPRDGEGEREEGDAQDGAEVGQGDKEEGDNQQDPVARTEQGGLGRHIYLAARGI